MAPVGFLANRNHQAALLACAFPLLAACVTRRSRTSDGDRDTPLRWVLLLAASALLISIVVLTGSRAGVFLTILGLASGVLIARRTWDAVSVASGSTRWLRWAPIVMGGLLISVFYCLSRAPSLQRLFAGSVGEDQRLQSLPHLLEITRQYMPLGSGFGTFDRVYRIHEPYHRLDQQYLNHAHNDLVELALTAGLPGLVLTTTFLAWFFRRCVVLIKAPRYAPGLAVALAGAAIVLILLAASLVDYPLRTPLMMLVCAIAVVWVSATPTHAGTVQPPRFTRHP
jgi:O-antigen ligase